MECKVLQHRNNAMRVRALTPRFRSKISWSPNKDISTTKACYSSVKSHAENKVGKPNSLDALPLRPNDHYPIASLLLQIFVTHPIDRASAERSFTEVLEVSKKLFPDYHDRKTTVQS
ncbi:hypothetical protein T05_8315 [Trichinella murrelli]|uniref:Uncharacterized protein n=1 Tax=Trichinella murrelli TaxID=144512 RepID=A0A0V0TYR5_9BILA|nr:hypothetical protein T05_14873 [Trichinella murrelli]KRX44146.1 hypothetical protein T05_8315 [Trichinella murrelli]